MKIDITAHIHLHDAVVDEEVHRKLDQILTQLATLMTQEVAMSVELDRLTAQVTETRDLEQSAVTLIQGIAKQLHDAAAEPAKVQALADSLHASATALSEAITANTPQQA